MSKEICKGDIGEVLNGELSSYVETYLPGTKLHKDDGGTTICETTFKQMIGSLMN